MSFVKTLTILSGATDSEVLDVYEGDLYGDVDILIEGPAALTGTVTVKVCSTSAGTFIPLQSAGSDITIPAVKGTVITPMMGKYMKLVSGGAEGANRVFIVTGISN